MNTDELIGCVYKKDYLGLDRLITSGNINEIDSDGRSPLIHAVLAGNADAEMVKYLLAKGADTNLQDKEQKWTPLHFAARDQKLSIVKTFLEHGVDIDSVDVFGNTPLWRCVMAPNINAEVVQCLIENGANPIKKNFHGKSPVDILDAKGRLDLIAR